MTKQSNSTANAKRSPKALLRRLGCLSSLSVFSSGVALAQAPSPSVTPSISASAVSREMHAAPIASPEPSIAVSKPSPVVVVTPPERTAPEQSVPEPPVAASTKVDAPSIPVEAHTNSARDLIGKPFASPAPTAAEEYEAPSTVVFSERSSGCEFSVQKGQVSGCAASAPKPSVAHAKPSGISKAISNVISGVVRPNFTDGAASIEVAPVNEASQEEQASSGSVGWNGGSSAIGNAYSTVQSYYNRTIRPLGMPGNGNVTLLFPLSIPVEITSLFGWRIHPVTGAQRIHTGTDLGAPMGTPVLAALTGRVIMAGLMGGYGIAIGIEHADGTQQTLYGHLSEIFVKPGDIVQQGTAIGRVGSTGVSTGPHLHFEFRQQMPDGSWVAEDAGFALEQSMAQLAKSLQVSQSQTAQKTAAN
jgi:murein DD-endopeptidase MepM/ murein hydrolase activator NlpD